MSRHSLAICFDFGDTLVDEASEVKDETLTTLRAELIPGAGSVVRELKRRSYTLALVADGRRSATGAGNAQYWPRWEALARVEKTVS